MQHTTPDPDDDTDDRAVSLRPSDYVDADGGGDDLTSLLGTFVLSEDRTSRLTPRLSRVIPQALEKLAEDHDVTQDRLFCCAVWVGLARIRALPDVQAISGVYDVLTERGANRGAVESWSFSPNGRDGLKQKTFAYIPPRLIGCANGVGLRLGLDRVIVYEMALRAGLAGVTLPVELADQLRDDVDEFKTVLVKRRTFVLRVLARAGTLPVESARYDW